MSDVHVRIVKLPPMRIASVRVVSESPERNAWEKMHAWAEPKGLFENLEKHPVFGFNNPSPTPESKVYGYEFWIAVDPDTQAEGEVEVKDFAGGLYAVTTCKLFDDPSGSVPEVWKELWDWVQASQFKWRHTHELERLHNPLAQEQELVLDLYLPIDE